MLNRLLESKAAWEHHSRGTYATFRADQVEKQVSLISGSASPRYPEVLRMAGVEGKVVVQFVVDDEGRVEEKTLRFVRHDNPLFDEAVRTALARMRFAPAEVAGRKVRQLVEMPFVFALSR
jgi:periplasmic protein TonB